MKSFYEYIKEALAIDPTVAAGMVVDDKVTMLALIIMQEDMFKAIEEIKEQLKSKES